MEPENIYYHVTSPLLSTGSIIENGNFGRLLEKYNKEFGDISTLYREEVMESVRKDQYSHKPSRFNSVFLLDSLKNATHYRDFNARNQNIYKVKIVESQKEIHRGFWCPPFPMGNYRQYCFEYATRYWAGSVENVIINTNANTRILVSPVELIVESPIEILERLDV